MKILENEICCLRLDWYFSKKAAKILPFPKIVRLLPPRNWKENLNSFFQPHAWRRDCFLFFFRSHVPRREHGIDNDFSWPSEKKSRRFSREFQGSRIPPKLWNKLSTHFCSAHFWTWCRTCLLKWSVSPCFHFQYCMLLCVCCYSFFSLQLWISICQP